jgi:hypothetical protein
VQRTVLREESSSCSSWQGERNGPSSKSFAQSFGLKRPSAARGAHLRRGMWHVTPFTRVVPQRPNYRICSRHWACCSNARESEGMGMLGTTQSSCEQRHFFPPLAAQLSWHPRRSLIYIECLKSLSGRASRCAGILHNAIEGLECETG